MAKDSELWDMILYGLHVSEREIKEGQITRLVAKTRREYNEEDNKKIGNNLKAKKLLVCIIGPDEYNCISACESEKEISNCLWTAHEGTSQVKEYKVDMLTTQYEAFTMKESETIQEMHTIFTSITNELLYFGEVIPPRKQVRKIQGVFL